MKRHFNNCINFTIAKRSFNLTFCTLVTFLRVTRDSRCLPKKPKKALVKLWIYKQFNVSMLYFLLERCVTVHLNKLFSLQPRMICAKFYWNCPSGTKEVFLLFVVNVFSPILPYVKKAWPFIWTNLKVLHPRMIYAQVGLNSPSGSFGKDLQMTSMYTSCNLPLEKRTELFFWTKLIFLYSKIIFAKFCLKFLSGAAKEINEISSMYFNHFLPLEIRSVTLYYNKFNSLVQRCCYKCGKLGWN